MATTKCVCVWQDTNAEPDTPSWIVSVDEIDLDTNATDNTATIDVFASEHDAMDSARLLSTKSGLPMYRFESSDDGYALGNRHTRIE
jgi:hypothetical protein